MSGRGGRVALVLVVLAAINLYVFLFRDGSSLPDVMEKAAVASNDARLSDGPLAVIEPAGAVAVGPMEPEWITGQVKSGDSLGGILKREGLGYADADPIIRSLSDHMDLRAIRAGQKYRVKFGGGTIRTFEYELSRVVTVRSTRSEDGTFKGERLEAPTEVSVLEIGGVIQSSLYGAFKKRGLNMALVAFFVDVFAYDLNFYIDQHKGDTFRVLVEEVTLNGEFLRFGRILGAEYSGKAGTFRAFWWQRPGAERGKYFDEKGNGLERTFLKTPLKFTRVSSKFNRNRMHPVLHTKRAHLGVDFAAPTGTPIAAAADGRIAKRGWCGGAGNCVVLKHANGLSSIYMHMSKFRKGQRTGQRVRAKQIIGYVGMTGLSTGPHLHFGVKKNGRYVDPFKLKMERVRAISKKEMPAFKAAISKAKQRLARIDPGSSVAQASR